MRSGGSRRTSDERWMGRGQRAGEGPGPQPDGYSRSPGAWPPAARWPTRCDLLAATPYGANIRRDQTLAAAQHEVAGTLLWDLRVLAGWLPSDGVRLLRTLSGLVRDGERRRAAPVHRGPPGRTRVPARRARHGLAPARARRRAPASCGPRWPLRPGGIRASRRRRRCAWACARAGRRGSPSWASRPGPGPRARPRCWWTVRRPQTVARGALACGRRRLRRWRAGRAAGSTSPAVPVARGGRP